MTETAPATQEQSYETADLPEISTLSSTDQLQEVMDIARIAANAQRDLEAAGEDPNAPADDEDETPGEGEEPAETVTEEPAEEAQESEEAEQSEEEPAEEEPSEGSAPQQPNEPSYSRRDAARFKTELDAASRDVATLKAQLQQHQASDISIIRQIQDQAGSEQEYQQLTQKNNLGQANDQERQRLAVMTQWRQVAGPIFRQAQVQVVNSWASAFQSAAQLDGMDDNSRAVMNGTDPTQSLQAIHAAGMAAGAAKAQSEFKAERTKVTAENQRLKQELSSLKTKQVAAAPQPATPDGNVPGATPKLPPMLNEDGTLNPEFEKLASSGKLLGVERLTG